MIKKFSLKVKYTEMEKLIINSFLKESFMHKQSTNINLKEENLLCKFLINTGSKKFLG